MKNRDVSGDLAPVSRETDFELAQTNARFSGGLDT